MIIIVKVRLITFFSLWETLKLLCSVSRWVKAFLSTMIRHHVLLRPETIVTIVTLMARITHVYDPSRIDIVDQGTIELLDNFYQVSTRNS